MTTCSARKVERAPSAIPIVFYPAAGHSSCLTVVAPVSIHRSRARSLARSLARADRTDSDKRRRVATASIPSCAIYPRTRVACSSSCPAGEGGGPRIRGELCLCARGREGPSRLVFRLVSRSKDRSSSPLVRKAGGGRRRRKKQRERERERERGSRARSCTFPQNWTGSISRGHPSAFSRCYSRDCCIRGSVYKRVYVYVRTHM